MCKNGHCQFVSKEEIETLPNTDKDRKVFEDAFNIKINNDQKKAEEVAAKLPHALPKPKLRGYTEAVLLSQPGLGTVVAQLDTLPQLLLQLPAGTRDIGLVAVTEVVQISGHRAEFRVQDDPLPELLVRPAAMDLENFEVGQQTFRRGDDSLLFCFSYPRLVRRNAERLKRSLSPLRSPPSG